MASEKIIRISAGTLLIRENDSSRRMFILKEGKVKVFKSYLGKKVTLSILGKGEVFGELSFFDAEPRSASVEALTDIEVIIIDGDQLESEINNLPKWVSSIFKSVFYRFRETDEKLAILQNMYEFQKKTTARDIVSQTIYLELLRYNQALRLVFKDIQIDKDGNVNFKDFYKAVDSILGKKDLGLRAYFRSLIENNLMVEIKVDNSDDLLKLHFSYIDLFNSYLSLEIESERYLILSHNSIALLRACIGYSSEDTNGSTEIYLKDLELNSMPFLQEAVTELRELGLLVDGTQNIEGLSIQRKEIQKHYIFQSIIKSFDHDVMQI